MKSEFLKYMQLELNRSDLTVNAYDKDLSRFADFLDMNPDLPDATSISSADIRGWLADMARAGVSGRSMRRRTQSVRAFFRWMRKKNLIADDPTEEVALPKMTRKLPEYVREQDMESLLSLHKSDNAPVFALRNKLIVSILYSCGIRRDELVKITDADIDFFAAELRIHGKRNKTRIIPMPPDLMREIKAWQQIRDANYILPKPAPLICSSRGALTGSAVYGIVRDQLLSTGSSHKGPHSLRHTFATSLLNDGAEINSVKELLGHASLESTQIYTHLTFNEIKRAYNAAHPRAASEKNDKLG